MGAKLIIFQHLQYHTQQNRGRNQMTPGCAPAIPAQTHESFSVFCLLLSPLVVPWCTQERRHWVSASERDLGVCLGCFACMGKDASLILRKQTEKRAVNLKAGSDYRGIQELRRGHVRLPLLLASVRSTKMWGLSWHKSRCLHAAALNDTTGRFGAARFLLPGCAAPKHHLHLQQHLSEHQNIHLRI